MLGEVQNPYQIKPQKEVRPIQKCLFYYTGMFCKSFSNFTFIPLHYCFICIKTAILTEIGKF